jgi:chemotaxis protein MotB
MARGKHVGRYTPRRRGDERDDNNRWLGTYGDMVTLLMAFFVLLYAMSEIDVIKFAAFVQGLAVPFGNVSAEGVMPASDGLLPDDPSIVADERATDGDPSPERPTASPAALAAAAQRAEAEAQLDELAQVLDEALEAAGVEDLVERRREERGLVVSISSDDVLFALGSTEIDPRGRRVVATIAEALGDFPNPVQVEGHTDDLPIRRSGYTNWNLSTDRAVAVLSLLIERYGLPPDRVGAVGYGEYRPIDDNRTSEGRARNRRVDVVVLLDPDLMA